MYNSLKVYLASAIALFLLAGILLIFGLPYTITHPAPNGLEYCCSYIDGSGQVINGYYQPIYGQLTLDGILVSIIGTVMLMLHKTNKDTIENTT